MIFFVLFSLTAVSCHFSVAGSAVDRRLVPLTLTGLLSGNRGRKEGPPAQRAGERHQGPEEEAVVRLVLNSDGNDSLVCGDRVAERRDIRVFPFWQERMTGVERSSSFAAKRAWDLVRHGVSRGIVSRHNSSRSAAARLVSCFAPLFRSRRVP